MIDLSKLDIARLKYEVWRDDERIKTIDSIIASLSKERGTCLERLRETTLELSERGEEYEDTYSRPTK